MPGLERQLRIAEFLDRETAQIDELIAKQEQLISTLAERRQAATGAAVTRGLDADVALRDSGDVAVGKIPVTWKFSKLAYLFDLIGSGTTPPSEQVPDHYGEGIPWVTTGELRENTIFETAKRVTPTAIKSLSALKVYPAGSLVIAMYGATIGRLGVLGVSATTNQACCVLAKPRGVLADFVYLALQASQSRLLVRAYGGGQPNISQEVVRQFRLAVPPVAEQRRIVDHLSGLVADTKALEERANESIALLRERRQALISAAVTGQIDVGGAS